MSHSFSSVKDVWMSYNNLSSAQGKVVLLAVVICIISKIWKARNVRRFEDKNIIWSSLINEVKIEVAFSGNNTPKVGSNSIMDFKLLNYFNIKVHPPNEVYVKEFLWHPPILQWIKCNTDGAASGIPLRAACGGIFRDHVGNHKGKFSKFTGAGSSLVEELYGAMLTVEIAK
ncbi:uncharacterized protein LOC131597680 [Vicia villosa]|uniref:uncharacterized protein LOC131597680 n=1 Tax=Vicia villosa TaxID=3911 RepID=UPI00273B2546|nr:uncharacterized protein LOC131597680 [Vicia villosa]